MKIQEDGFKECSKCHDKKLPTQFYKDKKTSDRLTECCKECSPARKRRKAKSTTKRSISDYIAEKTEDGVLMANYNVGVLKAVSRVKDAKDLDVSDMSALKGTICVYKGIPITADVVQKANQWLMENWKGRPGQRATEAEVDTRTFDEKFKAMEYNLKEMGYKLVKIDEENDNS